MEPLVRQLPCSEAMKRVRNALDRPSPLDRLLSLPAAPINGVPGLRASRSSPIGGAFPAMEVATRDTPEPSMPPHLLPEPPCVGALMAAARASLREGDAPPPPSGLEPSSGSRAGSQRPSLRGDARPPLDEDSAGGPPPAVPQLSRRGADRSVSGVGPAASATFGSMHAAGAAHVAAAAAARAEAAALAAAARAESVGSPSTDFSMPPAPPKRPSPMSPVGPLATTALEARKLPPSPGWLDDSQSKVDRSALGNSLDESFGVSGSTSMGQWRSGRSPGEPSSLLSAVSTAVPERSRPSTPRQDKESSPPEKLRMDLDGAGTFGYGYLGEQAFKTRGHERLHEKYRSHSMPVPRSRMPMRSYTSSYAPMTLPMVPGWQQVTASVTPVTLTMAPAPVAGQYPLALCNQCTTSWFPPPLPPVPCELTARLEALEHEVHTPQPSPEPAVNVSASREVHAEHARLEHVRLERTVESLRKQLAASEAAVEGQRLDGKMTAAQELKQQCMTLEGQKLRQDLQAACEGKENEQRAREELERMHAEVVAKNARLQADFSKLQSDYDAERRAKQEVSLRHEVVEADARNLKLDLERLRSAHNLELDSTRTDSLSRHQAVEELAKKLQADLKQMEVDRSRETQARVEVQQKFDAAFADAEKLRADVLQVQAARDAEQRAREDVELKHRLAEAGQEQLRKDLQQLQAAHDVHQRGRQDAEGRCGAAEMEVERVRADLNQQLQMSRDAHDRSREDYDRRHGATESEIARLLGNLTEAQEEASHSSRELSRVEFRLKELSVERDSERALAASHSSTINEHRVLLQKARQTEGDLWCAEEKVRTYEARLSGMQAEIEELRSRLIGAEAERDQLSFDKKDLMRTKEQHGEVELTVRGNLEAARLKLREVEAERDQLKLDNTHLKTSNQMRQDSEVNLRHGIDDERKTVHELRTQLETVERELELKAREFQERLDLKEREHLELLQRHNKDDSGMADRLLEVQQKFRVVETERDRLQSDVLHLNRAMEQREESESSLRRDLEQERDTVLQLQSKLEIRLREHKQALDSQSKIGSGVEDRLTDVQQRLRAVETERDLLQSDVQHLKRAKEQREESEVSLRKGIEEERKTVRELRYQLETLETKLQDATEELEEREREARTQLAVKDMELKQLREERHGKEVQLQQKTYIERENFERSAEQRRAMLKKSKSMTVSFVSSVEEDMAYSVQPSPRIDSDQSRKFVEVDLTDDLGTEAAPREAGDEPVMEFDLTDEMDSPGDRREVQRPTWGTEQSEYWNTHEGSRTSLDTPTAQAWSYHTTSSKITTIDKPNVQLPSESF